MVIYKNYPNKNISFQVFGFVFWYVKHEQSIKLNAV